MENFPILLFDTYALLIGFFHDEIFFLLFCWSCVTTAALQPVILINGLAGSNLNARLHGAKEPHAFCNTKKDWFRIWVNTEELVPGVMDCFFHNVIIHFNNVTKKYILMALFLGVRQKD